jgi:serine phosphatase RsbU (regulator of sigma subunit)
VADQNEWILDLLTETDQAAPEAAIDVISDNLRRRFGAERLSFLMVDLTGRAVARLTTATEQDSPRSGERIDLFGTVYERVIRTQQVHCVGGDEWRVIAPVSNRGDAIGLLEMQLPKRPSEDTLHEISQVAHATAYIVIANDRFTDLYTWRRRSRSVTLAAEIQYQLLPPSLACEAAQFALAGNLEPSERISGDTFDYCLDRENLHLAMTDSMGHDVNAALAATILINALRNARRKNFGLVEQARHADLILAEQTDCHATGQLLRIGLRTGQACLINAGHPLPLLVRAGVVGELACEVDQPFGVRELAPGSFRLQKVQLQPGDRLVMLTDGMLERQAEDVDLASLVAETRKLRPREASLMLTQAVLDAAAGHLEDDATVMCLDWYGSEKGERQVGFNADTRQASPASTRA